MNQSKIEDKIKRTKGQALVDFVLRRYEYSKEKMITRQQSWKSYYDDYRGQIIATKEEWQANYIIPSLKEIIRIKVPLYLNILFSAGIESFEIEAGEEGDETVLPLLKSKLLYDLDNTGKGRGGLFGIWTEFVKQYELYGYSVAKIPWKTEKDKKGHKTFDGPDMETIDIFHWFPDPSSLTLDSWKVIEKNDVFISYLRRLEKAGIYFNLKALRDTNQGDHTDEVMAEYEGMETSHLPADKVDLLEYHGEIPKSLLEGKISDEESVDPYEDDYVDALVTIGNKQVVIRAEEYPYDCGNIFVEACKDRMPNEKFGIGTGEDIQAMALALTQAYNKFDDCVSLISLPTVIVNPNRIQLPGDTFIVRPGGVIYTNSMVDNVAHAVTFLDTSPAAAALNPLIIHINKLDERIQKLSNAVPTISPTATAAEMPETLGATQIMQANAAEPIKHETKHQLEPAFKTMLEIYYKHNLQFFNKDTAYRILGRDKADLWIKEMEKREITKEDLKMKGNPDFIPKGVSVFQEKNTEIQYLLKFLETSLNAVAPALDEMGNPIMGQDGKPVMIPKADVGEIIKRLAEQFSFKDIEKLLPYLKAEREEKEIRAAAKKERENQSQNQSQRQPRPSPHAGVPTPASPQAGNVSPALSASGGISSLARGMR